MMNEGREEAAGPWLALALAALGSFACSTSDGGSESNFLPCERDTDCPSGSCVERRCTSGAFPDAGDGAASKQHGDAHADAEASPDANADAAPEGGSDAGPYPQPGELADACFSIPTNACEGLVSLIPVGNHGLWEVSGIRVIAGSPWFAVQQYRWDGSRAEQRTVAIGARGGCGRLVAPPRGAGGGSWSVVQASTAGAPIAVIEHCAGRFGCGTELYVDGVQVLDLEVGLVPLDTDAYGDLRHAVDVDPSGSIVVASGPTESSRVAEKRLRLRWLTQWSAGADWSVATELERPTDHAFVDVALMPYGRSAIVLHDLGGVGTGDAGTGDGGQGAERPRYLVEHLDNEFGTLDVWEAPPGVAILEAVFLGGDLGLAGEATRDGVTNAWFARFDGGTWAPRWVAELPSGHTPVGVDGEVLVQSLTTASRTDNTYVFHAFDATGALLGEPRSIVADGAPASFTLGWNGESLLAASRQVMVCP